jgi:hypothetical protein
MATGVVSVVDKIAPTPTLSIGAEFPGEEFAAALAAIFNFSDKLLTVLDSPVMLAARKNADVQAALARMDADLSRAQQTGDIAQVDKDSSG